MKSRIGSRGIGRSRPRDGRYARVVDRLVIHGPPIEFRELCRRAVSPETRYLILDLDRTFHLGRNMGEILGWELCAYHVYGPERLKALQAVSGPGRLLLDWSRPGDVLRYFKLGLRMWAGPGLYYLVWGKIAARANALRRWSFLLFGPEPVRMVQRIPQTALMHQLAELPLATLRMLSAQVWQRHAIDQVIEADDIRWLRERCPNIRIIITSASPQPMLEAAAEMLGVDDVVFSAQEEHEGFLSAPYWLNRLFALPKAPNRLSPPSKLHFNSSHAKIDRLLARYPDLCDPGTVSVGISDTGYGEDHCWANYFTRVIDVNSTAPFSPIVAADSPLREVHSAGLLTRGERDRRAAGEPNWLDPRRPPGPDAALTFDRDQLEARLSDLLAEIEHLAYRYNEQTSLLSAAKDRLLGVYEAIHQSIEEVVEEYNAASSRGRTFALERLRHYLRQDGLLRAQLARLERPVSDIAFGLTRLLEASRAMLTPEPPATVSPGQA